MLLFDPAPPIVAETETGAGFPVRRLFCLGRNYAEHAVEMGQAAPTETPEHLPFFTKWAEAAAPSGAEIAYPSETSEWHHEVELVAALHGGGANVAEADALALVWGYAVGIDMTRRDLQARSKEAGHPWDWGKNGPQSAPLGPIAHVSRVGHPTAGRIALTINGETRQEGDLGDMLWSTARTIAYISRFFALTPGDLIYTGTPSGVGPVEKGDVVEGTVEGLWPVRFYAV